MELICPNTLHKEITENTSVTHPRSWWMRHSWFITWCINPLWTGFRIILKMKVGKVRPHAVPTSVNFLYTTHNVDRRSVQASTENWSCWGRQQNVLRSVSRLTSTSRSARCCAVSRGPTCGRRAHMPLLFSAVSAETCTCVACWRLFCRALCRLCSSCSSSSKKQIEFLLLGCCPSTTPSTWPSELACLLVPLPHSWLRVCSVGIFVREALPLGVQRTTDVYTFHLCLERGL